MSMLTDWYEDCNFVVMILQDMRNGYHLPLLWLRLLSRQPMRRGQVAKRRTPTFMSICHQTPNLAA